MAGVIRTALDGHLDEQADEQAFGSAFRSGQGFRGPVEMGGSVGDLFVDTDGFVDHLTYARRVNPGSPGSSFRS